jgi:RHS repeat-associated protein
MMRKLIATGIAIVVSIPLIPLIDKGIKRLTSSGTPMVFPSDGWKLSANRTTPSTVFCTDLSRSVPVGLDAVAILGKALPADDRIWLAILAKPDERDWRVDGRIRNAYQGGDITFPAFTGNDAAGNHFAARGEFGRYYIGYGAGLPNWAGWYSEPGKGFPEIFPDSNAPYRVHLLEDLRLFAGGANQHTSWRPSITALSPASATAGGPSFALTINGSGFDNRAIVSWGETADSESVVIRLKGSNTIGGAPAPALAKNYLAQNQSDSLAILAGTALGSGLNLGINTSGGITNWLSAQQRHEHMKATCAASTHWCAMFITDGGALSTPPRPDIDLSAYQTLVVELSGDPGSAPPNNGTETEVTVTVRSNRMASTKGGFVPPALAEASKNTNKYKFADETQLPATGLYNLRARYYNPSGGRFISSDASLKPTATANNGDARDSVAKSVNQQSQRVAGSGWYALQVGKALAQNSLVELEFVPDNKTVHRFFTLQDSGNGGQEAGLVHIEEPGSMIIRASGRERPALRGVDNAEFTARWRESTIQRGFLSVTFLNDVLPLMAYILVVCLIRGVAYWLIGKLPRAVRKRATEEVDLMLAFAKWAGVACYTIWTAKDILAGMGIVLAK